MVEVDELLNLSKLVATQAGLRLLDSFNPNHKCYVHSLTHPREVKAIADTVLEREILDALIPTGLTILSEESGYIFGHQESKYWFVIDPLDGTFNFVKGLGPSAVSIALWEGQRPVFGVIYSILERQLFWGGDGIGAYCDGQEISVSGTSDKAEASICTGFPVRFNMANDLAMQNFWRMVSSFAKVRMLGAAAVSLLHVAKGSTDVYSEQNIMLWDVAAGIAIVEGAGGCVHFSPGVEEYSLNVYASNRFLCESD